MIYPPPTDPRSHELAHRKQLAKAISGVVVIFVVVGVLCLALFMRVMRSARQPASEIDMSVLSAYKPADSGSGIIVCEPVPGGTSADIARFASGCGDWLDFAVGGQPGAGKTPQWQTRNRAVSEAGKMDLRWNLAQAQSLCQMTGVDFVAVGNVTGSASSVTITYQVYRVPSGQAFGSPLKLTGTEREVIAQLNPAAEAMARTIGIASPTAAPTVALAPDDVKFVADLRWQKEVPSDQDQLRLRALAAKSVYADMLWLSHGANLSPTQYGQAVTDMTTRAPQNMFAWGEPYYVDRDQVPDAVHRRLLAIADSYPTNFLMSDAASQACRVTGDFENQPKFAARAVSAAPNNPGAWLLLAWAEADASNRLRQGRTVDEIGSADARSLISQFNISLAAAKRSTQLDPNYGMTWECLFQSASAIDKRQLAHTTFWKAVSLAKGEGDIYGWGVVAFQSNWVGSVGDVQKVVDAAFRDPSMRPDELRKMMTDVFSKDPSIIAIQRSVCERLIVRTRDVLSRNPRDKVALYSLADAQQTVGDYAGGIKTLRQLLAVDPKSKSAYALLGSIWWKLNDRAEAINTYQTLIRLHPDDAIAHASLGSDYKRTGHANEAIAELKTSLAIDPNQYRANVLLADAYGQKADWPQAEHYYKQAIKLAILTKYPLVSLSWVLDRTKNYKDSLTYGLQAKRFDPTNVDALTTIADCYLQLSNYATSVDYCNRISKLAPNNVVADLNRGEDYIHMGRKADARAEWHTVVSSGDPHWTKVAQGYLAKYP